MEEVDFSPTMIFPLTNIKLDSLLSYLWQTFFTMTYKISLLITNLKKDSQLLASQEYVNSGSHIIREKSL